MKTRDVASGICLSMSLRLATIAFAIAASITAHAEILEELTYNYYTAVATAGQPLHGALDAASPIRENDLVFHGHTRWDVTWHFRWANESDGRCHITAATVTLKSVIRLPLLRADSLKRQQLFDRYLESLRKHELGHHQIGRDAAKAVEQEILSQPEMRTCKLLEQTINQRATDLIAGFNSRNLTYDQQTEHGKTQGAWLTQ
ncbi:hypothetical protein GCM10025770_00700 [Viridibacterium curvum]|uniref:DUF922 domain-containing protein n=2 Tax=Viridibacterium curvum TaxID=1101404 RepID=A0ABP9QB70_9RHOO